MVPIGKPATGARGSRFRQEFLGNACGGCVKILFDANTPAPLARFLRGHDVTRADELGWQGLENGALLDKAEDAEFDVLVTCDQNVRYQQNFTGRKLALVILTSNHWPTIQPVGAQIARVVDFMQTGQITKIDITNL